MSEISDASRIEQVRAPLEKLARWYETHPGVSEHKFVAQQIRLALVGYSPRLPGTADFRED